MSSKDRAITYLNEALGRANAVDPGASDYDRGFDDAIRGMAETVKGILTTNEEPS